MTRSQAQDDWKDFSGPVAAIDPEALRKAASKFDFQILRRNLLEVGVAVFVISIFASRAQHAPNLIEAAGNWLVVAASVFVGLVIAYRGNHRGEKEMMALSAAELRKAMRDDFERQAALLQSVRLWYLAPFLPGFALILAGRYLEYPTSQTLVVSAISVAVVALVFVIIDKLNRTAAKALRQRVALLD